jgi:pSer/pThr/pTyr-binding forkhead associated (FHA) protein
MANYYIKLKYNCDKQLPLDIRAVVLHANKNPLKVGRSELSDVVLGSPYVSQDHCSIIQDGDLILLKNTSSNGCYVNRSLVKDETVILTPGDEVAFPGNIYPGFFSNPLYGANCL